MKKRSTLTGQTKFQNLGSRFITKKKPSVTLNCSDIFTWRFEKLYPRHFPHHPSEFQKLDEQGLRDYRMNQK